MARDNKVYKIAVKQTTIVEYVITSLDEYNAHKDQYASEVRRIRKSAEEITLEQPRVLTEVETALFIGTITSYRED